MVSEIPLSNMKVRFLAVADMHAPMQITRKVKNGHIPWITPRTRKYMHAETLALLNSKHEVLSWLHNIIRIILKLENPAKISLLITK
jgi:hypothetical protein